MNLEQIIRQEIDQAEQHFASTMSVEDLTSPMGYGLTLLLSQARRDPCEFYKQARTVRDLLSSIVDRIEAAADEA